MRSRTVTKEDPSQGSNRVHSGGGIAAFLPALKCVGRAMSTFRVVLGAALFVTVVVLLANFQLMGAPNGKISIAEQSSPPHAATVLSLEPTDAVFANIDESVLPPIVVGSDDQVCALCADGVVYVHVGRPAHATETVSADPQAYTAVEEVYVERATAPVFRGGAGTWWTPSIGSSEVVSRCLAQLAALGQIGVSQSGWLRNNGTKPLLNASVIVDYDSAGPRTSIGVRGRCTSFLAEVRPATDGGAAKMDVSYPRLPSWPLPSALAADAHGGADAQGMLPAYFGTARVRETDVDKDVLPPLSVTLADDKQTLRIRFGEDQTSTRPEAFEMECPTYFFSASIGRFGRQHNQVQEIAHTLAFARRLNRTFVVPVLVAETYAFFLRFDAQKVYGFNALRREGGYCLVSYAEARAVLKELEGSGAEMTMRRFNYYAEARPKNNKRYHRSEQQEWSLTPGTEPGTGIRRFNIDGWFDDSKAREPPVTTVLDTRAGGMHFIERDEDFTVKRFFPAGDETKYSLLSNMRTAAQKMIVLLGGDHGSDGNGKPQVRLGVLSSRMAFYLHPSLKEQTRVMGLLRPSEAIVKEADRLYTTMAAELGLPTPAPVGGGQAQLVDTLRPGHFKGTIGLHVRRREGTCRKELLNIAMTIFAIDSQFKLDQKDPSWWGPLSTVRTMELDCALTSTRLVELYRQYTGWLRRNVTEHRGVAEQLVPRIYMAYDDQSGPIADDVGKRLAELQRSPQRDKTWGDVTSFPSKFVAAYDRRIQGNYKTLFKSLIRRLDRRDKDKPRGPEFDEKRRVEIVMALYDQSLKELLAMAFDYFLLTNTEVFRGAMLSSVATNVVMRRWGRGLPCHGALPGYLVSQYTPMWDEGVNG